MLQTILATIPVVLIWFVFGAGGNIDPNTPYFALLASANVIWGTSMVLLFADIFFVKRFFPQKYEQVRRVPDGLLKLCGVLGILASAVAVWATFAGPGTRRASPRANGASGWASSRSSRRRSEWRST